MNILRMNLPGIFLCLAISVPSWLLGQSFPMIGSPVFGMMTGILITSFFAERIRTGWRTWRFEPGIKMTSKKLLQLSVILLGFGMNLLQVFEVGRQSILVILATLSASFAAAFFVGKALKLKRNVVTLIGVGTSICGGSAIAATAPVIEANDEEVAHAISTIFLFNVLAVLIFPPLGRFIGLSDMGFGMWAGTAVNDTSSVVAAGTAWSSMAGNDTALAFATIVKLTRTLMIVPITLALALNTARRKFITDAAEDEKRERSASGTFNFVRVFPWFVVGFIAAAVANTALVPSPLAEALVTMGKFLIVMAMTAIGLNTNLKRLLSNGVRPILLGICCWLAVAGTSLLIQGCLGMW